MSLRLKPRAIMSGFRLERHIVMALLLSSAGLLLIGYESLVAPDAGSRWIGDILFLLAALALLVLCSLVLYGVVQQLHKRLFPWSQTTQA